MRGRCHGHEMIRYVGWAPERSEQKCQMEAEGLGFLALVERFAKELFCGE